MIALLLLAAPMPSPAPQDFGNVASLATMQGKCERLVTPAGDRTGECHDVIINTAYRNDHSSFMVQIGDNMMVSFYGEDHQAVGDSANLVVTRFTTVTLGENKPRMVEARGECTYTNPYAGPSHVECHATTAAGDYALSFVSDGKPPNVKRF